MYSTEHLSRQYHPIESANVQFTNPLSPRFISLQVENGDGGMETITVSPGMHQMMIQGEPQVLQVLSLKDAQMLSKAMGVEVKDDGEEKMYTIK